MLFAAALFSAALELTWNAPVSCPGPAEVHARVRAQMSGDAPPTKIAAIGSVRGGGQQWTLDLEIRVGSSVEHRTLAGESCDSVTDAAALLIALRWIETPPDKLGVPEPSVPRPPSLPPAASDEREPTRPPVPREAKPPAPQPDPGPAQRERTPRAIDGWAAVSGGLSLGVLPRVGGAFALAGGIDGRRWRAAVFGRLFPTRVASRSDTSVRGRFDLASAGVGGCGLPRWQQLVFPVCGLVSAGGLRGEGLNAAAQSRVRWRPWLGVSASAGAIWQRYDRVAPFLAVEGTVAPLRPGFSVGDVPGTFYAAGRLGFRAWAGIELRLKKAPQKTMAAHTH